MKLTTALLPVIAIVLCLSCNKSKQSTPSTSGADNKSVAVANGKIVYVEIDSVMKHYEMAKELFASLETKSKTYDADLSSKQKSLQSAGLDFQNKIQKGLVTQAQAQEMQQQLSGQEQGLYQLRDQYRGKISEEAQVNQRNILSSIMEFLKEYNKTKGYQYIMADQFPGNLLYADSTLNITNDVIAGLNAHYKTTKGSSKK